MDERQKRKLASDRLLDTAAEAVGSMDQIAELMSDSELRRLIQLTDDDLHKVTTELGETFKEYGVEFGKARTLTAGIITAAITWANVRSIAERRGLSGTND